MRPPLILLLLLTAAAATDVAAHGGGLNKDGCHNNHKTGDYHCHRASAPVRPVQPVPPPDNLAPPGRAAPRGTGPGGSYRNCDEARAAGAAPVRRGEPGYGPHLDRDNDGIGCEPYRGR